MRSTSATQDGTAIISEDIWVASETEGQNAIDQLLTMLIYKKSTL